MSSTLSVSVAREHAVVVTSDTVQQPIFRALFINGSGDVSITDWGGVTVVYENVSGILPVSPFLVTATGTTATNIIGLI